MLIRAILLPAVLLASFNLVSGQDGGEKFYDGELYGEKAFMENSGPQTIDEAIAWAAKDKSKRSMFDDFLGQDMISDGMDMFVSDEQYNRLHSGAPTRHERQLVVRPRIHRIIVKQTAPDVTPCRDRGDLCAQRAKKGHCTRQGFAKSMRSFCSYTCGYCRISDMIPKPVIVSTCWDTSQHCTVWAKAGYCRSQLNTMRRVCKRTCGLCGA